LLRDITVARIFWLSQSEERKNSAKPKKWPSMIRNVSLVNEQTDRLALPYNQYCHSLQALSLFMQLHKHNNAQNSPSRLKLNIATALQFVPLASNLNT
jgi:hypothetical protein